MDFATDILERTFEVIARNQVLDQLGIGDVGLVVVFLGMDMVDFRLGLAVVIEQVNLAEDGVEGSRVEIREDAIVAPAGDGVEKAVLVSGGGRPGDAAFFIVCDLGLRKSVEGSVRLVCPPELAKRPHVEGLGEYVMEMVFSGK